MKIKLHPLFFAVAAVTVWTTGISVFVSSLAAVLFHELSHAFVARQRGYVADNILLLPYGAVLYNHENIDKTSNVIIAIAGPLSNFLFALVSVSFWWLIPSSYPLLRDFVNANICIGLFNLLPVWPLDGGRIVFTLSGYKPRAMRLLKICGITASLILAALFAVSIKYGINYSLLIMAIFLFSGVFANTDAEYWQYLNFRSPAVKDYDNGVTEAVVMLSADATLKKALLMIKPNVKLTYKIIDKGVVTAIVTEEEMRDYFNSRPLSDTVGTAINLR